jgi:hypothetical protein
MPRRYSIVATISMALLPYVCSIEAQSESKAPSETVLVIDLATAKASDSDTVASGRYRIRAVHLLPRKTYTIRIADLPIAIPVLATPPTTRGACDALAAATAALDGATKESDVPALLSALDDAEKTEQGDASCATLVLVADSLRSHSEQEYPYSAKLESGHFLRVTLTRTADPKTESQQWTATYIAPGGEWRVTYGFAFPTFIGADAGQTYFSKQSGSVYVISPQHRHSPVDAMPSVLYSYMPSADRGIHWNPFAVGLGFDLANPSAILGTGITYNANLQLTVGVLIRHEPVLLGQYKLGDTVNTNLTTDQLQTQAFKIRPYFGISLRLGANPFGTGSNQTNPDASSGTGAPTTNKTSADTTTSPTDTTGSSKPKPKKP